MKKNKTPTVNISPNKPKPVEANFPNDPDKGILAVNGNNGLWYVDKANQHMIPDTEELTPGIYTVCASIEGVGGEKKGVAIEKGKTTTLYVALENSNIINIFNNPAFAMSAPVFASPAPPGYGYLKVNNAVGQSGGYCSVDTVNWKPIPTTIPLTPSTGYTVYVKQTMGSPMYWLSPVTVVAGKTTTIAVTFQ